LVLAFAGFIIVLALGFAVFARKQQQQLQKLKDQAENAESVAVDERAKQQAIVNVLLRLFKSPPTQVPLGEPELKEIKDRMAKDKLDGLRYISFLINQNRFPLNQISALIGPSLLRDSDPEIKWAAQDVLNQAIAAKAMQEEDANREKLDAIREVKVLMDKKSFPPELVLALLGPTTGEDSNPALTDAMRDLLTEAVAANSGLGISIAAAVNNDPEIANIVPARVYIQIESQQQSGKANSLKAELEKQGYIVPGFEVVAFRAPRRFELRYYRQADAVRAEQIVTLLKNLQPDIKLVYLKGFENSTKLRPGHYELWLATQSKPGQEWYLVVNYSGTEERQAALYSLVSPITEQEGGKMEELSAREWLIGPYSEEQTKNIRQRLVDKDSNLKQRIVIIRR
jgi:hypothetical protein